MMNLLRHVEAGTPFPWRKQGLVLAPSGAYSHASHPCAVHTEGDTYVVAFTRRDSSKRSHIFLAQAEIKDGKISLDVSPEPALAPGPPCHFDCDGVISTCFVKDGADIYLYFVGWQNLPEGLWICDTGRAVMDPGRLTLRREFPGPVLGRDKTNPLFAAATAFHLDKGLWRTWYNSGLRWEKTPEGWKHHYGIHYADSADGVNWTTYPGMCLPFADEREYAFGRPTVIHVEGRYFMWYAHRATRKSEAYRIGFASSVDGRQWRRADELAGIDVSPDEAWDSEMICYPSVLEHGGFYYMLYNGNDYGRTGFGLAVMGPEA